MKLPPRDLLAAASATAVCAVVVSTVPLSAVRTVFALPLCFVLPGYGVVAAVFGSRRPHGAQLLMLVLALSFATLVLGSLVLDLPHGLRAGPWTALLAGIALAAYAIAWRRRDPLEAAVPSVARLRPGAGNVLLLGFACVAVVSALVLSQVPLSASHAVGYTELWMTGPEKSSQLRIGVLSAEQHVTAYRLEVRIASMAPTIIDLTLNPAQQEEFALPVPSSVAGRQPEAQALLYKVGAPGVYRSATARLPPDISVSP